jgi:hypothetical protein
MTKNWKKFTAEKKKFLDQKLQFRYLSLGLHKERPSYRRSLPLSKEAIQHFKTWTTFVGNFCLPGSGSGFRIRIRIHWPDWIRIRNAGCGVHTNWPCCRWRTWCCCWWTPASASRWRYSSFSTSARYVYHPQFSLFSYFFFTNAWHPKSVNVLWNRGDFTYVQFLVCLVPSPYADRHRKIDLNMFKMCYNRDQCWLECPLFGDGGGGGEVEKRYLG